MSFTLGDKEIKRVPATKVLGLTIDEDLSYKQHSEEVLKSLHCIWANLCKYSNRHWGFKQDVMLYLVKTLFISKLSYASPIWATEKNLHQINSLWYKILKSITGAVLNVGQNIAEVILGVPPLQIQTKINSIKHFLKHCCSSSTTTGHWNGGDKICDTICHSEWWRSTTTATTNHQSAEYDKHQSRTAGTA